MRQVGWVLLQSAIASAVAYPLLVPEPVTTPMVAFGVGMGVAFGTTWLWNWSRVALAARRVRRRQHARSRVDGLLRAGRHTGDSAKLVGGPRVGQDVRKFI